MTAVISGTNGLLQSYDYQTPTTGFTYTFAAGTQVLVMNPAGTLATGTITMPASPADGMTITFSSSQQITALTMAGNGASINNAVTFLPAKTAVSYVYRATGATWWPTQSVPGTGSQLVQGTSVATTSGTSIDFTGIPSWVKRITVMFNGVSTNGTTNISIQLGTGSTTYTTSGYLGATTTVAAGSTGCNNISTGFTCGAGNQAATTVMHGSCIITNITGNTWVANGNFGKSDTTQLNTVGGSIALAAALTAIRITAGGTDTFDAGSINILYE